SRGSISAFVASTTAIDPISATFMGGNVGIGTSSPSKRFSVAETVSDAQVAIAYDTANYAHLQVDSVGDLIIDPSGDDVFLNADNLWVCTGGSCPAGTPSGTGNLVVETRGGFASSTPWGTLSVEIDTTNPAFVVSDSASSSPAFIIGGVTQNSYIGIGTTTPSEQLSVASNIFVGGNGAPSLGTATSTFEGDIIILGKLDVGTIDPPYTIGGTTYATFGHSTIGVKEEVAIKIEVSEFNEKTNYFEYVIDFDTLIKDSDLWLFHQITDFGKDWDNLVVTLTPAFDGKVFYTEDSLNNILTISSTVSGNVSLRLIAPRFDAVKWPNIRSDQNTGFKGFILNIKEKLKKH
ncbi:MAG: hypothetical protein Q8R36_03535, partial [bacterium]|nr:hypothetical protein [bacterium]